VIAKRFRFDVEIDEIMKALAHWPAGGACALERVEDCSDLYVRPYATRAVH
jgi:hypothetical protein